jgi:hypothetical protein
MKYQKKRYKVRATCLMKRSIIYVLILSLSACSTGSGLGPRGSPLWFETASETEIQKYKSESHRKNVVSNGAIGALLNTVGSKGLNGNFDDCLKGLSEQCDRSLLTAEQINKLDNVEEAYLSQGSCAENGSCFGDISTYNGRPKTVRVRGYYRNDGTYVRGHYRSK